MTDKEISNILNDIVIICDTREQKNQHILDYFKENNIKYITQKLDSGDYSFYLPNYPELNLDKCSVIEKKNSLDEITQNFTKGRDRFKREFERIPSGTYTHLIIEKATWKKLLNGSYRSQLTPKSFMASLLTFANNYDIKVWFAGVDESPTLIYNLLYYDLFNKLKEIKSKGI